MTVAKRFTSECVFSDCTKAQCDIILGKSAGKAVRDRDPWDEIIAHTHTYKGQSAETRGQGAKV